LKHGYNVTTPASFWAYWNTMQYQKSGADVLRMAQDLFTATMQRVATRSGHSVKVMTFAQWATTLAPQDLRQAAARWAQDEELDLPEKARRVTEALWRQSAPLGPAVILGFASIPYSAVSLRDQALRARIENAVQPFGIGALNYFAGISDMSFFGEASADLDVVAANTPIWGSSFVMAQAAGFPTINLGPWGRDYHHWLERLHTPYAFEVLPRALLAVIEAVGQAG
jgi:arginine utilization protein RocB